MHRIYLQPRNNLINSKEYNLFQKRNLKYEGFFFKEAWEVLLDCIFTAWGNLP